MLVLGIESTCDETAAALVEDGHRIVSSVIASQEEIHRPFGGVFPELASRSHMDRILPVIQRALDEAGSSFEEIDLIAVAYGPGLLGSLLIGLNTAKGLALASGKPWIGVNHVEAHLYAAMMSQTVPFPSLGLVASGGHTFLMKMEALGSYQAIGTTLDDAIGEAFDKVASLLGLPYPGGPELERLALQGDPRRYRFSPGHVKRSPLDFSFSGLKTAVRYAITGSEEEKPHIAAAFQETALKDLLNKVTRALQQFPCQSICFGGGVCANRRFRELFEQANLGLPLFWPPTGLTQDNAAMIAGLGFQKFSGISSPFDLLPQTRIPLDRF